MNGASPPSRRIGLRIAPGAALMLREAVAETGGMEVFAVGEVEDGTVTAVTITARGREDRVNALLDRPRPGQVVIHNHPSGDLRPSDADMALAGRYGEDGVGFVIIDNTVTRSNFVVEPVLHTIQPVTGDEVTHFFTERLARAMPGWEAREPQLIMARAVAEALHEERPLLVEAGTGTGKSLAYLVPAALWALKNDQKVIVATHTRALQAQILASDLPMLRRGGLEVRAAVLEGRGNYLCKRRLQLARDEADTLEEDGRAELGALVEWAETTPTGSRSDLPLRLPPDLWERVESDSDLSLRHRCEHFESCHFYNARRNAAGAHLIVVNHALLLVDLAVKAEGGTGVLPSWHRLILDEAQHLEDVATGALSGRVTPYAVRRAVAPLVGRGNRSPGALTRTIRAAGQFTGDLATVAPAVARAAEDASAILDTVRPAFDAVFSQLSDLLDPKSPVRRFDGAARTTPEWHGVISPQIQHLVHQLDTVCGALDTIRAAVGDQKLPEAHAQPFLDLDRARKRLSGHATTLRNFAGDEDRAKCRWMEASRERDGSISAAVCSAPIEVAETLRRILWDQQRGVVGTSATISVSGDFRFWRERVGLPDSGELVLPSPFDHATQAMLGLPKDLPAPDEPGYLDATAGIAVDAVRASGGGAFVLCTSFNAVNHYAAHLRRWLPPSIPVLAQGEGSRPLLLERFREHHNAVLVGTDSFWEGVSVKGDGLRLVILPRLPFRVPTEPLQEARHERIKANGQDPFRTLTLPHAVLKLRQGYGRLIRSVSDRGVVLLLDRRVHDRWYGRVILATLPPARRVVGPWQRVLADVRAFYTPPAVDPAAERG